MYTTNDLQYSIRPAVRQVKQGAARLWRERVMEQSKQWAKIDRLNIVRIEKRGRHWFIARRINGRDFESRWLEPAATLLLRAVQELNAASARTERTENGRKLVFYINTDKVRSALAHHDHSWDGARAMQNERVMAGGA